MALTQISTEGIKNGTITGLDLATNVDLVDNQKLRFGTGNDLEIYHNGSHSLIADFTGQGNIYLITNQVDIKNAGSTEHMAKFVSNGAVELYYDNSKKFETTSIGVTVTGAINASSNVTLSGGSFSTPGNLDLGDSSGTASGRVLLGAGDDLQIYHDGNHSYIQDAGTGNLIMKSNVFRLRSPNDEEMIIANENGNVKLYYDNSKKFETTSGGVVVTGDIAPTNHVLLGDNKKSIFGAGLDLQIYHDGTNSIIEDINDNPLWIQTDGAIRLTKDGASAYYATFNPGGAVELYFDGVKKFETTSNGVSIPSDTTFLEIGAGQDLDLHHNGTNSYIRNKTGNLHIRPLVAEEGIILKPHGAVELYYDNTKRLETDASGVKLSNGRFFSSGTFAYIESSDTSTSTLTLKKSASGADSIDYLQLRDSSNNLKLAISGSGDIDIEDNAKLKIGSGDDLLIYHDGNNSFIENAGTGSLNLYGDEVNILNAARSEFKAKFISDGAVELYFNNNLRLSTTDNGVSLFGDLRFNNGTWTGECLTGKIQTHSGHMYFQNASTSGFWIFRLPNGTEAATINSSGTYASSDERRKKDITTITGAVDIIKKLTGRSFTWKEDNKKSFGLIAQEVETVLPDLITTQTVIPGETNSDPYKMINYSALTGYFIEAVKELSTKIDVLQTEVAALKAS